MTINATRALKALGITHDVRFRFDDLTFLTGGQTDRYACAATDPRDPTLVRLDPRGIARAQQEGEPPEHSIAHELVHVRQFQEFDTPVDAYRAYKAAEAEHGYWDNPFEVQAETLAPQLARLIQVTP